MKKNIQTSITDPPATNIQASNNGTGGTDVNSSVEASLRAEIYELGFAHGKVAVRPIHGIDDAIREQLKKPEESFFADYAQRYINKMLLHIRELKDEAVHKGAPADNLKDTKTLENYSNALHQEITTCENNEFYGKNLVLYIFFAFLLCTGDILMGDYIAKEILQAGNDATWKGYILGFFCIALGVILEIIINNLYTRSSKRIFNFVITIIPLMALFMFVGIGILRAGAINMLNNPTGTGSPFPAWSVKTFFIGMSLAAPTALGCVLFIIQKKAMLMKKIKKNKVLLNKVGGIINAEHLLDRNETDFTKDLSAEYDLGFNKGQVAEIFTEPKEKPKPPADPEPPGSLADRLKHRMLKKHGLNSLLWFCLTLSLFSCKSKPQEAANPDIHYAKSILFLGISAPNAGKQLQAELSAIREGTTLSVIWPEGVESVNSAVAAKSSLIAKPVEDKKIADSNHSSLQQFADRFINQYKVNTNGLPSNWQESSYRLFALVSEQFQGKLDQKDISFWLGGLPYELLTKSDSLIRQQARSDAEQFAKQYSLKTNQLAGANIHIYIPSDFTADHQDAETVRRTCLYYRETLAGFGAVVLSVKTVNI